MKRLFPILAVVLALASCAPTRYVAPDQATTLDEVARPAQVSYQIRQLLKPVK